MVGEYKFAKYYDFLIGSMLKKVRLGVADMADHSNSILEVASGTGEQAFYLSKKKNVVVGVDISDKMIQVANQKVGNNVKFFNENATKLSFKDGQFDISIISLALHEMNADVRTGALNEMVRVTKKGGYFIICDYVVSNQKGIKSSLVKGLINSIEALVGGNHFRNYKEFMSNGGLYSFVKENDLLLCDERVLYGGNIGILKIKV